MKRLTAGSSTQSWVLILARYKIPNNAVQLDFLPVWRYNSIYSSFSGTFWIFFKRGTHFFSGTRVKIINLELHKMFLFFFITFETVHYSIIVWECYSFPLLRIPVRPRPGEKNQKNCGSIYLLRRLRCAYPRKMEFFQDVFRLGENSCVATYIILRITSFITENNIIQYCFHIWFYTQIIVYTS